MSTTKKEFNFEYLALEEFIDLDDAKGATIHTDFLIRMANNELLHCLHEGEASEECEPIIILTDTSGSRNGDRLNLLMTLSSTS